MKNHIYADALCILVLSIAGACVIALATDIGMSRVENYQCEQARATYNGAPDWCSGKGD